MEKTNNIKSNVIMIIVFLLIYSTLFTILEMTWLRLKPEDEYKLEKCVKNFEVWLWYLNNEQKSKYIDIYWEDYIKETKKRCLCLLNNWVLDIDQSKLSNEELKNVFDEKWNECYK